MTNPSGSSTLEPEIDADLGEAYYGDQKYLEDKLTNELLDVIREFVGRRFNENRRPALRDAHAKDNGCVTAIFRVDDTLNPDLQHGIFKHRGRSFKAWIRFSSGNSEIRSSRWPDPHAMAIKLVGVEGNKLLDDEKQTQDFVLIDSPVFFVDDLARYKRALETYLHGGDFGALWQWASLVNLRGREIITGVRGNFRWITNHLFHQYWSATPYRLGAPPGKRFAVKYTAKPRSPNPANTLQQLASFFARDFSLKDEVAKVLKHREVNFDFYIQRYVDDERTPIEDSKVAWDEAVSKPEHVATLTIESPNEGSPARDAFCEHLSFNPWHSLPDHKPLGTVNRVRKKIYLETSKYRHQLNGVPRKEPTGNDGV